MRVFLSKTENILGLVCFKYSLGDWIWNSVHRKTSRPLRPVIWQKAVMNSIVARKKILLCSENRLCAVCHCLGRDSGTRYICACLCIYLRKGRSTPEFLISLHPAPVIQQAVHTRGCRDGAYSSLYSHFWTLQSLKAPNQNFWHWHYE